jgi:hypothetical protein
MLGKTRKTPGMRRVRRFASHLVDEAARGGRLVITDDSLRFRPSRCGRVTGGQILHIDLSDIALVDVPDVKPRRQLRVTRRDGTTEYFIVNRVDSVVQELQTLLANARISRS